MDSPPKRSARRRESERRRRIITESSSTGARTDGRWSRGPGGGQGVGPPFHGGEVLAVASLAAFLGGFVGGFAKDMGAVAGKASAEAIRQAATRLRFHLRKHADKSERIIVDGQSDARILVVQNVASLPDAALEQLVGMELPEGPVVLSWDHINDRWRSGPPPRTRPATDDSGRDR